MYIPVEHICGAIIGSAIKNKRANTPVKTDDKSGLKVVSFVDSPVPRKNENLSVNSVENSTRADEIKNCVSVIERSFKGKDLSNFHHNIKNVRVFDCLPFFTNLRFKKMGLHLHGCYKNRQNTFYLKNDSSRFVISHELLHLASSNNSATKEYSGFRQHGSSIDFGVGLNEGYTELLNNRYFNNSYLSNTTPELQLFTKSIEDIVGKDKMENLYLKADLKGLINELSSIYSLQEIENLIVNLDILYANGGNLRNPKAFEAYKNATAFVHKGLALKALRDPYYKQRYVKDIGYLLKRSRELFGPTYRDKIYKEALTDPVEAYNMTRTKRK